jgi:hypothetical protein
LDGFAVAVEFADLGVSGGSGSRVGVAAADFEPVLFGAFRGGVDAGGNEDGGGHAEGDEGDGEAEEWLLSLVWGEVLLDVNMPDLVVGVRVDRVEFVE